MDDPYKAEFKKRGLKPKDFALATGYLIGLGGVYTFGLWAFCFVVSPTKNIINRLPYPKLKDYFARANSHAEKFKILKKIPLDKRGPLSISLCETLVLKGVLGPVALPLKIWLSIKLAKLTNEYFGDDLLCTAKQRLFCVAWHLVWLHCSTHAEVADSRCMNTPSHTL